jgi:hypothetical protein
MVAVLVNCEATDTMSETVLSVKMAPFCAVIAKNTCNVAVLEADKTRRIVDSTVKV